MTDNTPRLRWCVPALYLLGLGCAWSIADGNAGWTAAFVLALATLWVAGWVLIGRGWRV